VAAPGKQTNLLQRSTYQPPRSRAFFLELLLNMLIFALCAVIALQVFVEGKLVTDGSAALSGLTMEAKNLAGYYKVSSGDLSDLVSYGASEGSLNRSSEGVLTYYYDANIQLTDASNAHYLLTLTPASSTQSSIKSIEISAIKLNKGVEEHLFSFEVVNYQTLPPEQGQGG